MVLGGGEAGGGVGPVPGRLEEILGKHIITNKIGGGANTVLSMSDTRLLG